MFIDKVRFFEPSAQLPLDEYNIAFFGRGLDERGIEAVRIVKSVSQNTHLCIWDRTEMVINFNSSEDMRPHEITDKLKESSPQNVLIEATTLGFVELLLLMDACQESDSVQIIDILYIEPEKYQEEESPNEQNPHSFSLSEKLGQLIPIPGYTMNFVRRGFSTHLIAFLGFEKSRLGRVLEDDEGSGINRFSVGIGVPAFIAGWENHTLSMNVDYLDSPNREGIYYLAANNPQSAYKLIKGVEVSLDSDERIILAPFGTKPAGIGAAVYAVSNKGHCGVIYDHPTQRLQRSSGIGRSHIYTCIK